MKTSNFSSMIKKERMNRYWLIILSVIILTSRIHADIPIGINMDGLVDWSNSLPYVNLIRQSRKWGPPTAPWDQNATFDPHTGWPTEDFGASLISEAYDLGGRYFLTATGNADVRVTIRNQGHIENKTYDATTNTLSAIVYVPQNITGMGLSFFNTTGPGLRDITLLQLGYNITSKSDITKLMLAHLSRFSIIRFMDWTNTNANRDVNWNDTTPLTWPIYREPYNNPWETIPFIVNQLDTSIDIWINIPFNASNDYILTIARLMLKELKASANIYVEYSNEVWNGAFPQGKDNVRLANDSVLNHGDPLKLNYDNISLPYYWAYRRTAYQIKRISDLFKTVFGKENVGPWKRVRPILAGQAVNINPLMQGLDYLNTLYGLPTSFIHGIAIAPYFTLGPYSRWQNLTVDQILAAFQSSISEFLPEQGWSRMAPLGVHAIYAAWYNLSVYAYESGPDFIAGGCPDCSLDAKRNASRDYRFSDICVNFLSGWYRFGFQTLNWFSGGARGTRRNIPYNLFEDMRQETLIDTTHMYNSTSTVAQLPRPSPRLKAIDEFRRSSVQMNFGIRIPIFNFNATNYMHHNDPYPDPDLRNLTVNSTFYYPLFIQTTSTQINVTVYVAGNASLLELGLNNDQFTQVNTPDTGNTTIFQPAPSVRFNLKLSSVPFIATLRLKTVQNGYSIRSFDITH